MNNPRKRITRFDAYDVALQIVRAVGPLLERIRAHDADLARQLRRAAPSVPLNVAEGWRRLGKDRTYHYTVAAGSADEVRAALHVAEAWGFVGRDDIDAVLTLIDRELAMLYRLTQ